MLNALLTHNLKIVICGIAAENQSAQLKRYNTAAFDENIKKYAPKTLCFNSKRAAETYLQRPVDYGLQPETIGTTKTLVAPSTSGAASKFWKIETWQETAKLSKA